jgi:hypothetical protein
MKLVQFLTQTQRLNHSVRDYASLLNAASLKERPLEAHLLLLGCSSPTFTLIKS